MPRGIYLLGESEYRKRLRRARKALGLCRFCTMKHALGHTACERHIEMQRASKQRRAA